MAREKGGILGSRNNINKGKEVRKPGIYTQEKL